MSCWILSQYRSGSTYLCYLLNSTNLFNPIFKEYFHFKNENSFLKKIYKQEFLLEKDIANKAISNEIFFNLKRKKIKLPVYCKIHREQYLDIFSDEDKKEIESYLNIRYILLKRDIFERTVSNYFSNYAKIWSLNKNNLKNIRTFFSKKIPFDEFFLLKIYNENLKLFNWDNYLKDDNFLELNYENLIKNPINVLVSILDYLDMDYSNINLKEIINQCPLVRMKRQETEEYIWKLKSLVQ